MIKGINTKQLSVVLIAAVVIAAVAIYVFADREDKDYSSKDVMSSSQITSDHGISVSKPDGLVQVPVSDEATKNGMIWSFVGNSSSQAEVSLTVYYQEDDSLNKLSSITKMPVIDAVTQNAKLQDSKKYSEYNERDSKTYDRDGYQVSETIFDYTHKDNKITQRRLIMVRNKKDIIYVRGQAKSVDFETMNETVFDKFFGDIGFK